MEPEKLRTEAPVIYKGKEIPKGTVLVVGTDVSEADASILKAIGKEIRVVDGVLSPPDQPALTAGQVQEMIDYMEKLEADVTRLEDRLQGVKPLERAANILGAITDSELLVILKKRKTEIPADADREQLLELIAQPALLNARASDLTGTANREETP